MNEYNEITESDREQMTEALLEDLVYRTALLTPHLRKQYIQRFREIWRLDLDEMADKDE